MTAHDLVAIKRAMRGWKSAGTDPKGPYLRVKIDGCFAHIAVAKLIETLTFAEGLAGQKSSGKFRWDTRHLSIPSDAIEMLISLLRRAQQQRTAGGEA